MLETPPHILLSATACLLSLLALLGCVFTWFSSRAHKVRGLEDQIVSQIRTYAARADQVDHKLGEWQVTITGILGEVEEFFDRTVKERQRIQQQNRRAEQQTNEEVNSIDQMAALPRAAQLQLVDDHFRKLGR